MTLPTFQLTIPQVEDLVSFMETLIAELKTRFPADIYPDEPLSFTPPGNLKIVLLKDNSREEIRSFAHGFSCGWYRKHRHESTKKC